MDFLQKLLAASRHQVENAQHLTTVVRNEHDGLNRELRNMNTSLQDSTKKVSAMEVSFWEISDLICLIYWDVSKVLFYPFYHFCSVIIGVVSCCF